MIKLELMYDEHTNDNMGIISSKFLFDDTTEKEKMIMDAVERAIHIFISLRCELREGTLQ